MALLFATFEGVHQKTGDNCIKFIKPLGFLRDGMGIHPHQDIKFSAFLKVRWEDKEEKAIGMKLP